MSYTHTFYSTNLILSPFVHTLIPEGYPPGNYPPGTVLGTTLTRLEAQAHKPGVGFKVGGLWVSTPYPETLNRTVRVQRLGLSV